MTEQAVKKEYDYEIGMKKVEELIARAAAAVGMGKEKEDQLATELTQAADEACGVVGMLEFAGRSLLFNNDLVIDKIAREGSHNDLFQGLLTLRNIDETKFLIEYIEKNELNATTKHIANFLPTALTIAKNINGGVLATWAMEKNQVGVLVDILRHVPYCNVRDVICDYIVEHGTWYDKASVVANVPNVASEAMREQVANPKEEDHDDIEKFVREVCDTHPMDVRLHSLIMGRLGSAIVRDTFIKIGKEIFENITGSGSTEQPDTDETTGTPDVEPVVH